MTDDTAIAELARLISESVGISIERGWIKDLSSTIHAAGWRRPGPITDAQVEVAARIMGLEPDDDETVCSCESCRESRTIANAGTRQVARAVLEAAAVPAAPKVP